MRLSSSRQCELSDKNKIPKMLSLARQPLAKCMEKPSGKRVFKKVSYDGLHFQKELSKTRIRICGLFNVVPIAHPAQKKG